MRRRWLKRRQAIEPTIGHAKADHRMDRCWLQGAEGDALHALSCAVGYNVRWLMRVLLRKAWKALSWLLQTGAAGGEQGVEKPRIAFQGIMSTLRISGACWWLDPPRHARALAAA